jgi:hypothetical protein
MRILDYETNKTLNDVALFLNQDEAEELIAYLRQLTHRPEIHHVHLSDVKGIRIERELTVALEVAHAA